jgi:putative ABC transport system permease protein
MLGVTPQQGRGFFRQEEQPGAPHVAVLSYELWQNRLGGDPGLVGKTIQIDGAGVSIVGIMPEGFHLPLMGPVKLWMPLTLSDDRHTRYLRVIARMKPGVSLARATGYLRQLHSGWPILILRRTPDAVFSSAPCGKKLAEMAAARKR